jgi:hypothetical protein
MGYRTEAVIGLVMLAAGGVLAWTAVIMVVFAPWPRRSRRVRLWLPDRFDWTEPDTRPLIGAGVERR